MEHGHRETSTTTTVAGRRQVSLDLNERRQVSDEVLHIYSDLLHQSQLQRYLNVVEHFFIETFGHLLQGWQNSAQQLDIGLNRLLMKLTYELFFFTSLIKSLKLAFFILLKLTIFILEKKYFELSKLDSIKKFCN